MKFSVEDISLILRAFNFAAAKHMSQKRKGGQASPYINHLIDVAKRLWETGRIHDVNTIAVGILHDIIEDTETCIEDLELEFNKEICSLVLEVTDDKSLPEPVRKRMQVEHAGSLSWGARQVKLADKISNIYDVMVSPPIDWSIEKRHEYVNWGEEVVNKLRGTNEYLENYFDDLCKKAREKFDKEEKGR